MAFNVLIVDDSRPMRMVIKKTIRMSGFDVGEIFEASNGKEALNVLGDNWIDLVLTDYNMPHMNGLKLLDEMKKDEVLRRMPAVMITTERSQQRIQQFFEMGASDCITKPFTPEEIRQKLNRIMGEPEDGTGKINNGSEGLDF